MAITSISIQSIIDRSVHHHFTKQKWEEDEGRRRMNEELLFCDAHIHPTPLPRKCYTHTLHSNSRSSPHEVRFKG